MNTYWGKSQTCRKIESGLYWTTTASHGGYMISKKKAEKILPSCVLNNGFLGSKFGNYYCFEEDCAYAVLEYILMDKNDNLNTFISTVINNGKPLTEYRENLKKTIDRYYPAVLTSLEN